MWDKMKPQWFSGADRCGPTQGLFAILPRAFTVEREALCLYFLVLPTQKEFLLSSLKNTNTPFLPSLPSLFLWSPFYSLKGFNIPSLRISLSLSLFFFFFFFLVWIFHRFFIFGGILRLTMTAPNMTTITASLERSLQNCSLNHERRSSSSGGGAEEGIIGRSSTSDDNNLQNTVSDTSLELNSHLSLPYHWEQCLDLKVRSFFVFFLLLYFFSSLLWSFEMVTTVFTPFRVSDVINAKPMADLALALALVYFLFFVY